MSLSIRDFRTGDTGDTGDAEAVTRIRRGSVPFMITTPQGVVWDVRNAPPAQHARLLVAELDGRVVGAAFTGLAHDSTTPGQAFTTPHVHPDDRGRGAGSALLAAAEEYLAGLGARTVFVWADEDPYSLGFAERRGYRRSRPARFLGLDLASAELPAPAPLPGGAELRTAADFGEDPRPLYEADAACAADEPGDIPIDAMAYDDWLAGTWRHPYLDRELTSVVVAAGGEVAAFTLAYTDGETRYVTGMTGCRRAHRGKGLAKAAKADSLRRARAAGLTQASTGNDAANQPMLAINRALGYEVRGAEWRCVRELG